MLSVFKTKYKKKKKQKERKKMKTKFKKEYQSKNYEGAFLTLKDLLIELIYNYAIRHNIISYKDEICIENLIFTLSDTEISSYINYITKFLFVVENFDSYKEGIDYMMENYQIIENYLLN